MQVWNSSSHWKRGSLILTINQIQSSTATFFARTQPVLKSFEESIEALHKFFSFPSSCRVESSSTPLCSMLPLCKETRWSSRSASIHKLNFFHNRHFFSGILIQSPQSLGWERMGCCSLKIGSGAKLQQSVGFPYSLAWWFFGEPDFCLQCNHLPTHPV